MVITGTDMPAGAGAGALVRTFVTGGSAGAGLASLVVAVIIESVPVLLGGLALLVLTALNVVVGVRLRRARTRRLPRRTALAGIESRRALDGEGGDVPVEFVLTVAPDDAPPFRVRIRQSVNLVDLPDYRPRGTVVVTYPPDLPWRATIVTAPAAEWAGRAAQGAVDLVPDSEPMIQEPVEAGASCLVGFVAFVLGAAVVLALSRGELSDDTSDAPSVSPSAAATFRSSTSSSSSVTTVGGPEGTILRKGEMRRLAEAMARTSGTRRVTELTVEEGRMAMGADEAPGAEPERGIDPLSLPYERLPALVEEARTTLGLKDPTSWRITVGRRDDGTGPVSIRVAVTTARGTSASLDADARGEVTGRRPG